MNNKHARLRNPVVFSDQCMSCRQHGGHNLNITLWAITPSLSSSANLRISSSSFSRCFLLAFVQLSYIIQSHSFNKVKWYTAKNDQVVAILMKTGLNNVVRPTLFAVVNNIEQYCYTRYRLINIVQYC